MKKNKKNEDLQSRREFFKSAAKGALPILALTIIGPSILTSCEKEDDDDNGKSKGKDCSNGCTGNCQVSCSGGCKNGCSNGCDEICMTSCANGGY